MFLCFVIKHFIELLLFRHNDSKGFLFRKVSVVKYSRNILCVVSDEDSKAIF